MIIWQTNKNAGGKTAKFIARSALIGALYALLTIAFAPISSGLVQIRVSEALCVLPYYMTSAIPGLFVGCLLANVLTGAAVYDVVFGSLATLAAAFLTHLVRVRGLSKWLAPLPAVVINAVVIGALLSFVYKVGVPFWLCAVYVGAGQAAACCGLGMALTAALDKHAGKLGIPPCGHGKDTIE